VSLWIVRASCLVALMSVVPLGAIAEPLSLPNQFILNSVHLTGAPESAAVIGEGSYLLETRFSVTNSFVTEEGYVVDAEQRTTELALRAGVAKNLELGLTLPILWRGGGVFDHTIRQWHDTFDLPDGERETVPDDQYLVEGETKDGRFSLENEGFSLGNLKAELKQQLLGGWDEIGWQAQVGSRLSLPTTREGFGHRGLDASLSGAMGYLGASWELSIGGALLFYGDRTLGGLSYDTWHGEGFLSAEIELWSHVEVLLGLYGGQQSVNNVEGLPAGFLYLDTGLRVGLGGGQSVVFLVRENPYPSGQSADVTAVLSYFASFPEGSL
jgi:hypothetical protein